MPWRRTPGRRGARSWAVRKTFYRLRSGDYRILYRVREKALVVLVLRIGHRREIYRRPPKRKPPKG